MSGAAEKQLAGLPVTKRQNVCTALTTAVRNWRTTKLQQFDDTWRIRIPGEGAVRVVYRIIDGTACIVFVGEHDAYDSFRRAWDGQVRGQLSRVSELEIVMKSVNKTPSQNGHADKEHKAAQTQIAASASSPAADMLWHGMLGVVANAVDKQVEVTLQPLLEMHLEQAVQNVLAGTQDRSEETKALRVLKSDLGRRVKDVSVEVEGVRASVDGLTDAIASDLHAIRKEVAGSGSAQADTLRDLQIRLAAMGEIYNRLSRREAQLDDSLQAITQSVSQMAQQVGELTTSLNELRQQRVGIPWGYRIGRLCDRIRDWARESYRRLRSMLQVGLWQRSA